MMKRQFHSMFALLGALVLGVSCRPSPRCGGERYYDPENQSCRPCPAVAAFEDGTCVCPAGMEFVEHRCRSVKGGGMEEEPADAAMGDAEQPVDGPDCEVYCEFLKGCFADNALAMSVAPEVITALDADDPPDCFVACQDVTTNDGRGDPVVDCIDEGLEDAACVGDDSVAGLLDAVNLITGCCDGAPGNALCESFCEGVKANDIVSSMVVFCAE